MHINIAKSRALCYVFSVNHLNSISQSQWFCLDKIDNLCFVHLYKFLIFYIGSSFWCSKFSTHVLDFCSKFILPQYLKNFQIMRANHGIIDNLRHFDVLSLSIGWNNFSFNDDMICTI